jgi:hypothetical protein
MLYVVATPLQGVVDPEMVPGWAGDPAGFTARELTAELPQALFATTLKVPPTLPDVTDILVADEVPDQPDGRVQL